MSNAKPIDFNHRIEQYVLLRDKIKEMNDAHKEVMKPYNEALEGLNAVILMHLNQVQSDSVKTQAGTAYRTLKTSASIADGDAFWNHIMKTQDFDLLDRRASKTAVVKYIEDHGQPPPGINYSSMYEVGVRRPTKSK